MRRSCVVVDGDPALRAYTRRCIERCGGKWGAIHEAEEAAQALKFAREGGVDLVVCAMDLSGTGLSATSGAELVATLRADPRLASVPVVLVTDEDPGRVERARLDALPGVALVSKPFSSRALCGAIQSLLADPPLPGPDPR
jgi:CheY-like chemotaxis protein